MSGSARAALAAAVLYLAVALFANRAVVVDPFVLLPAPVELSEREKPRFQLVYEADQKFVVGYMARVARAFALEPSRVADVGLCAPMSRAHTLGEHMFGQGLLGAIPYLLSRDPIFTFNAISVLTTWISLMAMYALAFYWTRSFPAALLAGLLFALHPNRLNNPAHIFVFGNAWTALSLLAVHRLFDRERWVDAALLSLFLCLQLLESFYPILGLAIVGGTYGLILSVQHFRRLPRLAPKLAAVALVSGTCAWLVFGPYLETQATWEVLQGRSRLMLQAYKYLPGQPASPGWILFVFAVVGLLDRFRGRRQPNDPRLPLFAAGFLLLWCSVHALTFPILGRFPSPLIALTPYVPGLSAVRALPTLQFGVFLLGAVFAAYGLVALLERLPRTARGITSIVLAAAILAQTFHPPLAETSFRAKADLTGVASRPDAAALVLMDRLPPGAVLDLPLAFDPVMKLQTMPGYLLDAGYYEQPTAACYNSFLSGLQAEVERLAAELPAPSAVQALSALGFRSVRVHHDRLGPKDARLTTAFREQLGVERIGRAGSTSSWSLDPVPTTESFDAIRQAADVEPQHLADGAPAVVRFPFARTEPPTFRHPAPVEPSDVTVTWRTLDGEQELARVSTRTLLPVALAAGDRIEREIRLNVPVSSGTYLVELARSAASDDVLSRRRVVVP